MPTPQEMKLYYERIFPADEFCSWLTVRGTVPLQLRELSFTLPGDVYVRYKSYPSAAALRRDLANYCPEKIDVGAVYTVAPSLRESFAAGVFVPQLRELVFDVDISDYDGVRVCCSGTKVCAACWPLMASAVDSLVAILRRFGFSRFLPVFSGRRGVHLWVCDAAARRLTDDERAAVVAHVALSGAESGKAGRSGALPPDCRPAADLHPSVRAALAAGCEPAFARMFLCDAAASPNSLAAPPRAGGRVGADVVADAAMAACGADSKLAPALAALEKCITACRDRGERPADAWRRFRDAHAGVARSVVLTLMYPRPDIAVTQRRNHLLKAPFAVHPATGNVCVPLALDAVAAFDPTQCPTVGDAISHGGLSDEVVAPLIALIASLDVPPPPPAAPTAAPNGAAGAAPPTARGVEPVPEPMAAMA